MAPPLHSRSHSLPPCSAPPPQTHHLAHDDNLGPQLLVHGEDVQQAQCEDHEVKAEDGASQLKQPRGQPEEWGEGAQLRPGCLLRRN